VAGAWGWPPTPI